MSAAYAPFKKPVHEDYKAREINCIESASLFFST